MFLDPAVKDMFKADADVKTRLLGLDIAGIMADPAVQNMLASPKLEVNLTPETLSVLGSESIAEAKRVAASLSVATMFVILFGFQTAIGNVQTLPSDFFGGKTVGTLAGFAGMAAKLTAFALTLLVPVMTKGANYTSVFVLGAILAFTAIASVWFLCGNIKPLKPSS